MQTPWSETPLNRFFGAEDRPATTLTPLSDILEIVCPSPNLRYDAPSFGFAVGEPVAGPHAAHTWPLGWAGVLYGRWG